MEPTKKSPQAIYDDLDDRAKDCVRYIYDGGTEIGLLESYGEYGSELVRWLMVQLDLGPDATDALGAIAERFRGVFMNIDPNEQQVRGVKRARLDADTEGGDVDYFSTLPVEMIINILDQADVETVLGYVQTNKRIRRIVMMTPILGPDKMRRGYLDHRRFMNWLDKYLVWAESNFPAAIARCKELLLSDQAVAICGELQEIAASMPESEQFDQAFELNADLTHLFEELSNVVGEVQQTVVSIWHLDPVVDGDVRILILAPSFVATRTWIFNALPGELMATFGDPFKSQDGGGALYEWVAAQVGVFWIGLQHAFPWNMQNLDDFAEGTLLPDFGDEREDEM